MIAVDTNILVYAHRREVPWHAEAQRCLSELAQSAARWAIPWPCLHEFLGVVTHPRIFAPPTPLASALQQVELWLEAPTLTLLSETTSYWPELRTAVNAGRASGPLVHDAHVAALCAEHGVHELWSADRDFSRFRGVKVRNPLIQANP